MAHVPLLPDSWIHPEPPWEPLALCVSNGIRMESLRLFLKILSNADCSLSLQGQMISALLPLTFLTAKGLDLTFSKYPFDWQTEEQHSQSLPPSCLSTILLVCRIRVSVTGSSVPLNYKKRLPCLEAATSSCLSPWSLDPSPGIRTDAQNEAQSFLPALAYTQDLYRVPGLLSSLSGAPALGLSALRR